MIPVMDIETAPELEVPENTEWGTNGDEQAPPEFDSSEGLTAETPEQQMIRLQGVAIQALQQRIYELEMTLVEKIQEQIISGGG